ncbi:unnamed protein product [Onchocerca flexuosa]|uniref:Neur_chan_LBD domain-containing protein n=1 Tax=Onchocerca flexuosa TaxID=387005 RepID=A0A183I3A6_9BILA|nr:unnamed protein product [Onchocerca flexuosa]
MSFVLSVLFHILLSVVFGRFIYLNEAKDYKKDLTKKSNESIFPTETLYRSAEIEYIRYRNEQQVNIKTRIHDLLNRMVPSLMLGNWIEPVEPPVLTIIDPDEQIIHFPMTIKDNNENDDNQGETESMLNKNIVSSTTKSTIQSYKQAVTTNEGLKEDLEFRTELGQQLNMDGTFEELNITEVYEEPFIRIYVKPLCEGPIC